MLSVFTLIKRVIKDVNLLQNLIDNLTWIVIQIRHSDPNQRMYIVQQHPNEERFLKNYIPKPKHVN